MMTDGYTEHIVKTKTPGGIVVMIVCGAILIVCGVVYSFTMNLGAILGLPLVIVGMVLCYMGAKRRECEFEYLMVNDDVEVARITAKSSRKQVCHFEGKDVKMIVPADSILLDNEYQANAGIKRRDYTSKEKTPKEEVYAFVLNKENRTEDIRLELSEKMLAHVRTYFKGKIRE